MIIVTITLMIVPPHLVFLGGPPVAFDPTSILTEAQGSAQVASLKIAFFNSTPPHDHNDNHHHHDHFQIETMLTSTVARLASHLASQGTASQPGKALVVSIKIKIFFLIEPKPKQVRISVDGDNVELPTNSEAYTLAVQEEKSGNIVVNIVADTYFGAR